MTIHVETHGAGAEAVVLLHGLPSDVGWARSLTPALSAKYRVLIPHLPGYGQTPPRAPYDWEQVREELATTLSAHGASRAALVGFSGGAWRALELAASGGLAPRAVVALGGLASLTTPERDGFRQFATALRAGADLRPLAGPRFLARRLNDPAAVAEVQGWLSAAPASAMADELEAIALEPDLEPTLSTLSCPVLARTGTADVACPPDKARAIAVACRHATLELVEGAAHALMLEDEQPTVASVMGFLAAVP
ncbi:MAG: alpha/beta fold hydrolase [Myxococcota bacterium]